MWHVVVLSFKVWALGLQRHETRGGQSDLEKIHSDSTSVPTCSLTAPLITTVSLSNCADMHASKHANTHAPNMCTHTHTCICLGSISLWRLTM